MGTKKVFTFKVYKDEESKAFMPYAVISFTWDEAQNALLEHLSNIDFTGFKRDSEFNYLD